MGYKMYKNKLLLIVQSLLKKRLNNYYITNDEPELIPKTQEEAYFVQNKVHSCLNSNTDYIIGRKIGCTTKVMQDYLKIDHPCAGTLRKSNYFKSGHNLNTNFFTKVGVECEIAVKLSKDLPFNEDYSEKDIYSSIESFFPAIEIAFPFLVLALHLVL